MSNEESGVENNSIKDEDYKRKQRHFSEKPITDKEKNEDESIKTALHDLLVTIVWFSVLSFIISLIVRIFFIPRNGFIPEDFFTVTLPSVLGMTLGRVILPAIIALFFKNKSRAFIIAWLIFTITSFYLIYISNV